MSSSDPAILSFKEAMERELSRFKNVIVEKEKMEMERVKGERDSLKKEVEELRMKMMESHQTSLLNKSILNLEAGGRTAADRFRPKEAYNSGTVIEKQVERDETPVASRDVAFKLTRCCDLNIINQIKKHLHCENLKRFEKSCFGHFLNLNHLKYQENVLLHLMMHMDMAASSNEKLVFRIKNSVVEFRPRDFSLITGLRLGELGPMIEMSSPSSSILRDVFKNRSTIFVTDIKAEFLSVSRANKGSGELVLKLAMLYFLHGNLLSDIPYFKKIDLKYFALVEDLDRFDEFPWGRLAFEFLALSLLSTRRWVDISNASHRRLSNQFMLGFSFALQVWAYEMMPLLAEFCEARVVNPDTTPTILRWLISGLTTRASQKSAS